MARLAVGMVFGVVVGMFAGAACGIRADEASTTDIAEAATAEAEQAPVEPPFGVWDRLAACEATGNWHAATGNGYSGGLQFDASTWRRHGGLVFAQAAYLATRAQQILIAERTLQAQGWAAWPACSRRLGLR